MTVALARKCLQARGANSGANSGADSGAGWQISARRVFGVFLASLGRKYVTTPVCLCLFAMFCFSF